MLKKLMVFLIIIIVIGYVATSIQGGSLFKNINLTDNKETETNIMTGVDGKVFDPEANITNEQMLIVFSRLMGGVPKKISSNRETMLEYCENVAMTSGVMLPSDLVYSRGTWENTWKDLLVGETLFEKLEDDKYSVTLIPGYFRIFLNEQGYILLKKGVVPPHIAFYSPFTTIEDLTDETLNRPATQGFILELMSIYDIYSNMEDYSKGLKIRPEIMRGLTTMMVQQTLNKAPKDWGTLDINRYNYVGLSYAGAMQYGILRGYVEPEVSIEDMNKAVKGLDVAVLINRIISANGLSLEDIENIVKIEK